MSNYFGDRISRCTPQNGDVLEGHNFAQVLPGTAIFEGVTGLTFRGCNLVNCVVPVDAVVEKCNTAQVDRCSHLHAGLPYTCEVECRHMTSKEEIVVDGVVVDTLYEYQDIVGSA